MADTYGEEEFAVARPNLKGGVPDRVDSYMDARRNTLAVAERDRQTWIDRGEDAFVVSRQWKVV